MTVFVKKLKRHIVFIIRGQYCNKYDFVLLQIRARRLRNIDLITDSPIMEL